MSIVNEHIVDIANDKIKPPRKIVVLKHEHGDTLDIVNVVLSTYAMFKNDVKEFAPYLRGNNDVVTCNNVWNFVKRNVKYVVDPLGVQWVKAPALTWEERRKGCDCKSYSILIGSILHHLDIPAAFRFVSFVPGSKTPTHVYVVAFVDGKEIIIDAVLPKFNQEKLYNHKIDHNMSRIYQMSGVVGQLVKKEINLGNKDITEMTEGELDLYLARERMKAEQEAVAAMRGVGSLMAERYQDSIDMLNDAIETVNGVNGIGEIEEDMEVIANMAVNGHYSIAATLQGIGASKKKVVRKEKKAARKEIKKEIKKAKKSGDKAKVKELKVAKSAVATKTGKFLKAAASKVKAGAKAVTKVVTAPARLAVKGILEVSLPKAAPFFLYLFINDPKIIAKLPAKVKAKRTKAEKVADFIVNTIGMKRNHFMAIVRTGIIKQYKKQPEQVLADKLKGIAGIGFISDAVKILVELINQIAKAFGKKGIDISMSDGPEDIDFTNVDTSLASDIKNQPSNQNILPNPADDGKGGKSIWKSF